MPASQSPSPFQVSCICFDPTISWTPRHDFSRLTSMGWSDKYCGRKLGDRICSQLWLAERTPAQNSSAKGGGCSSQRGMIGQLRSSCRCLGKAIDPNLKPNDKDTVMNTLLPNVLASSGKCSDSKQHRDVL